MEQMSLASTGFELITKRTRKREFLEEMNLVIPWSDLLALIAPLLDPLPVSAQATAILILVAAWENVSLRPRAA